MKVIFVCLFLTSCVTPKNWSSDDHRETMLACKIMCGKNRVKSYEPLTAECDCINNK